MYREYTILLDPPTYTPPTITAPTPSPAPAASAVSRTRPVVQRARPSKQQTTGSVAGTYGPVKRSETLWVIADKTRPDSAVSVEQMMMALHKVNPHAFQHDNVNLLRTGVTLDLPREPKRPKDESMAPTPADTETASVKAIAVPPAEAPGEAALGEPSEQE